VVWRYRRDSLNQRSIVARDGAQRGLTSETFIAFAAARLAADARGYASVPPDVAVVVPEELDALARARLAAAAGTDRPVRVIGEDAALMSMVPAPADGTWLVASVDDDALRLRIVRRTQGAVTRLAADELPEAGIGALRRRWLAAWNAEAASLVPGARAFDDGDSYEFERLWQELSEWLDADTAEGSRASLAWPLLRQSTVLTVCAHQTSLANDLARTLAPVPERASALCQATPSRVDGLVVAGPAAMRRVLLPSLQARLNLAPERGLGLNADAYARGAALLAGRGEGNVAGEVATAPYTLGVLGLGEDGAPKLRPLIQSGQALPASANFTIVADRDAQKQVAVTLTREGPSAAEEGRRYEFGPLVGSGMQRIGIAVEWRRDGSIDARAVDRETGAPLQCLDCLETLGGVALATARHLRGS
jgi:hypothetical protein